MRTWSCVHRSTPDLSIRSRFCNHEGITNLEPSCANGCRVHLYHRRSLFIDCIIIEVIDRISTFSYASKGKDGETNAWTQLLDDVGFIAGKILTKTLLKPSLITPYVACTTDYRLLKSPKEIQNRPKCEELVRDTRRTTQGSSTVRQPGANKGAPLKTRHPCPQSSTDFS